MFITPQGIAILKEMDDTDRKLLALLGAEPMMHIRELAKRLGISRTAAHKRIRTLMKLGVLKGVTAGISIYYLHAVPVLIFGKSNTSLIEQTLSRLGESELTRSAVVGGMNYLYVIGLLRNISELDAYAEFVRRTAEMQDPTVGINCYDSRLSPDYINGGRMKDSYKELSPLDLRIIASLKDNARRPIADIAKEVGASVKTVRRHLADMVSDGSLDLYVPWDAGSGGDMFTFVHLDLKENADKGNVGRRLLSKYYPRQLAYVRSYSNLPNFLLCILCMEKMTEMRKVLKEISEDEDVQSTMANLAYFERTYATWRDKLPAVQTHPQTVAK